MCMKEVERVKKLGNRFLSIALSVMVALSLFFTAGLQAGSLVSYADSYDPNKDVYEELDDTLKELEESEYDGFIVGIREDLSYSTEKRIENAVAGEEGIHQALYSEGVFVANDIESIQETIDERYIEYIEPNSIMYITDDESDMEIQSAASPNDPYYVKDGNQQYNLRNLKVSKAWELGFEGQDLDKSNGKIDDIIVAVIDTGIIASHPDFAAGQILKGFSIVEKNENTFVKSSGNQDLNGHGTKVTGIICATKDNGVDIAGITPRVKVLPVKVTKGATGEANSFAVSEAINIIAGLKEDYKQGKSSGKNICVINISLGTTSSNETLEKACKRAKDEGIIIVCSAGNAHIDQNPKKTILENDSQYPAQYTMGVGAVRANGKRWFGYDKNNNPAGSLKLNASNGDDYRNKVWVMAPGENIYSIDQNGNVCDPPSNGTSFSSPEVAALAAICKSIHNDMSQKEFMELLRISTTMPSGVNDFVEGTRQSATYGWGIVDYEKTINNLVKKNPAQQPTCTVPGKSTWWTCKKCGGTIKEVTIPALGHKWDKGKVTKPATVTSTGTKTYTCTVCKATKTETIPINIKPAVISGLANKTYNGKAITQNPTVKLGSTTLKSGTDYTVSFKNNVNVGTATVTVTGKGKYTGTASATFKINKAAIKWKRFAGAKAPDTMAMITAEFGKADTAILTTSTDFKDALAASALAGKHKAPILMTKKGSLTAQTSKELKRMGVKTVYILGSTNEIKTNVEAQIKAAGVRTVSRYAAPSASGRAIEASKAMGKDKSDTVIIATQASYHDALSVSPYAYASKSPILYVESNLKLSSASLSHIKCMGFKKAIIVGGPVAIPEDVEKQLAGVGIKAGNINRLAGKNAYKTSLIIAEWVTGKLKNGTGSKTGALYKYAKIKFQPAVTMYANNLAISTGQNWPDALAGSALCGKNRSVLLLSDKTNYDNVSFAKANKNVILKGYIFGGPVAVSQKVEDAYKASTK